MKDDLLKRLKCFIQYVVRRGSAAVSNGQRKTALLMRALSGNDENYSRFRISDIQIVQDQTWQNMVELEVASAHEVITERERKQMRLNEYWTSCFACDLGRGGGEGGRGGFRGEGGLWTRKWSMVKMNENCICRSRWWWWRPWWRPRRRPWSRSRRRSVRDGLIRCLQSNCWIGGRGRGRGRRGQRPKEESKAWVPVTKLGRLVSDGKIRTLEEIYLFSLPIKVRWTNDEKDSSVIV